MNKIIELTEDQVLEFVQSEDALTKLAHSDDYVALIMTQDWCPQWHAMEKYLAKVSAQQNDKDQKSTTIYWTSYNKLNAFETIMKYKESQWKNEEVPYVRYYHNGTLVGESNFVSRFIFTDMLNS